MIGAMPMTTWTILSGVMMAISLLPQGLNGQMLSVEGTATYEEPATLPSDAVFEATLEDVSRADAPSQKLGQTRLEQPGASPLHFSIRYNPAQVQPNHVYAVRARITSSGRLIFTTDQRYQVLTLGHGSEIGSMTLRKVSDSATVSLGGGAPVKVSLRDTYWKLIQVGDREVNPGDTQQEANLIFHKENGRLTGSGGCNRLMGSYIADGSSLHFNGVASTRMACSHGNEIESGLLGALEHVRGWKITGQKLDLLDENGQSLAQFAAATIKQK
jgi:putative lipoprotein